MLQALKYPIADKMVNSVEIHVFTRPFAERRDREKAHQRESGYRLLLVTVRREVARMLSKESVPSRQSLVCCVDNCPAVARGYMVAFLDQ